MLLTVATFREKVAKNIDVLMEEVARDVGRPVGAAEKKAWRSSWPRLSTALSSRTLQDLHLYFQNDGDLSLEYKLPAANNWCDVVLLGEHAGKPSAMVLELKDWMTRGDRPGRAEGLVERSGVQELHPSDQVRGYVEYCRRFHSAVAEHNAGVGGCVLFVGDFATKAYVDEPNARLVADYPIFTMAANDIDVRLPDFLGSRITSPSPAFAKAFERGMYCQDRGFLAQIGKQILDPKHSFFELLDDQRRAFSLCRATALEAVCSHAAGSISRHLVLIKGPPGSGKSAVAARLWASLVTDSTVPDGAVVFTTTSASQATNWEHLFDEVAGLAVGRGIVRRVNSYYPISTHRLGRLRSIHGEDFLSDPIPWRENLKVLVGLGERPPDGANDCQHLITIVDEAHALINPERPEGRGQFGFAPSLGPQAYHVLRCSLLTFMFLDPEQSFRDRENTSVSEISGWAKELGIRVSELDLSGMQFRCGGSAEYVEWVEGILRGEASSISKVRASAWQTAPEDQAKVEPVRIAAQNGAGYAIQGRPAAANVARYRGQFEFRLVDDPEEMEAALRLKQGQGKSVRLLSSFSRKWITRGRADPHLLPMELRDFNVRYFRSGQTKTWSRIWNFAPDEDYTLFVQAPEGSRMRDDPLCEVGCPYVVRGFDYDYLGLIWLEDLVWRDDDWHINLASVHETGLAQLIKRARKEEKEGGGHTAIKDLQRKVAQAYRILLTRALEGTYVWIPDEQTRTHVRASLHRH